MLAYSTTITPVDGPILSNPVRTKPILPVDVTLTGLKGGDPSAPLKASHEQNGLRQHRNRECQQTLVI
jgi:hypothetical protein